MQRGRMVRFCRHKFPCDYKYMGGCTFRISPLLHNGSEITGRRRNKKTLQTPKKGLQRCFLASQRGFEPPTPRLGVTIITYTSSIVVLHDSRSTRNYIVFRGAISLFSIIDSPLCLLVFRSAISKMLAVLQRSQNLNQLVRF